MAARRALIVAAVALAALALTACQVPQQVPPVVVVAFHGPPSQETFEAIIETVRAHGYDVQAPDAAHGTFRVASRYADRGVPVGSHSITVQLYASGHARIQASGPRVESHRDADRMPPGLRREVVGLAQILER